MYDYPAFELGSLLRVPTRKIFVSYHHASDQAYYDMFSRLLSNTYGIVQDNSVDRLFDSDDVEYVMRRIREKYITGTSCTIVLCGPETRWRKYVDWEIKATLDKGHGLIGVNLPHNPRDNHGRVHKPDRLQDNIDSGYATWLTWESLLQDVASLGVLNPYASLSQKPVYLKTIVEQAVAIQTSLINNSRLMRGRNGY